MASDESRRPAARKRISISTELRNIMAAAKLLYDRSLGLEPSDAEAVGYLAQRVEEHAQQALQALDGDGG